MTKAFFIDTTTCTGCRGCQIACKQWKKLPRKNRKPGRFRTRRSLLQHLQLVRMSEVEIDKKLQWLFSRTSAALHRAPCWRPPASHAIYKDKATGAVIYTKVTRTWTRMPSSSPALQHPAQGPDGSLAKCDMCIDGVQREAAACVQTCPRHMNFGDYKEMRMWPGAPGRGPAQIPKRPWSTRTRCGDLPDRLRADQLLAVRDRRARELDITRAVAMRQLFKPFTQFFAQLG